MKLSFVCAMLVRGRSYVVELGFGLAQKKEMTCLRGFASCWWWWWWWRRKLWKLFCVYSIYVFWIILLLEFLFCWIYQFYHIRLKIKLNELLFWLFDQIFISFWCFIKKNSVICIENEIILYSFDKYCNFGAFDTLIWITVYIQYYNLYYSLKRV